MTIPYNEIRFSTYYEVIASELRLSIRRYNDAWEDILWDGHQTFENSAPWIERHRLPVIILTCTLLESLANFYICTKCDANLFSKLEMKRTLTKWTEVPKRFVPTYSCPLGVVTDLEHLLERRNTIIHAKPLISIDGDNRHAGNEPTIKVDEHEFMKASSTLPQRLIENLLQYDRSFDFMSNFRVLCGQIAHDFETGLYRQKTLFDYPRELIEELMEQGFDRRTAIHHSIFLGKEPKVDETGHYTIYPGRKIQIKPLKFYGHKMESTQAPTLTS